MFNKFSLGMGITLCLWFAAGAIGGWKGWTLPVGNVPYGGPGTYGNNYDNGYGGTYGGHRGIGSGGWGGGK